MKYFKKLTACACMAFLVIGASMTAFAAPSKQDIAKELNAGVIVNGEKVAIPERHIKAAMDFFNANTFTDEQMDYAMTQLKEVKALVAEMGVDSVGAMTPAQQEMLIKRAAAAAETVGATFTYDNGVKVVDKNNRVYKVAAGGGEIKPTGAEIANPLWIVSLSVLAVLGLAAFVAKKNGLFAAR